MNVAAPPTPHGARLVGRALLRHCPVCGQRRIFRRWLIQKDLCPRCEFRFERQEGHYVGAVGINTILTFGALLITLVVGLVLSAPGVAVGPILAVGGVVAIGLPLFLQPICRMLWTAIDLMMQPLEPGEAPRLPRD